MDELDPEIKDGDLAEEDETDLDDLSTLGKPLKKGSIKKDEEEDSLDALAEDELEEADPFDDTEPDEIM